MRSASSQDHPFSLGMQYPVARTTETFGFKQSDKPNTHGNATRIRCDFRKTLPATANAEVPHLTFQTPRGLGESHLYFSVFFSVFFSSVFFSSVFFSSVFLASVFAGSVFIGSVLST